MPRLGLRNVAIIAHVDHGKTSLVDQLLRQCGQFGRGELKGDLILDSNPLERERGITILSKNCAIETKMPDGRPVHINLIDTPGHADFSGEVERVLRMADGALLLVDAYEGVMPQTRYVLAKALATGLKPILVVNKMDRPEARPHEVVAEVFDLLVELGADDETLDFAIVYTSAKQGWAVVDPDCVPKDGSGDFSLLFDALIDQVPAPQDDVDAPLQMLITTLDYNDYVGRIGIGRVFAGVLNKGQRVCSMRPDGTQVIEKVSQVFRFNGLGRQEVDAIEAGDLCAVVGLDMPQIGTTLTDPDHRHALPAVPVDEPTLHMTFRINDGPFSGKEGKWVTTRQIRDRLHRECLSNVSLRVEERGDEFIVSGRGLLHLGILLENMRREGYEVNVGKPEVITKMDGDVQLEPLERLAVDVLSEYVGAVMQLLGDRRAEVLRMDVHGERTVVRFLVPSRGLIGLRNRLLTVTRGEAVMYHRFQEYGPMRGSIPGRTQGVMVGIETGRVTAYALDQLADRGTMFVRPGDVVYEGQIIGEHTKDKDILVNVVRQKQLTNMRMSVKDATVTLKAPRVLSLEDALEYVEADELVELTPASIRLRKRWLTENERRRMKKK